LYDCRISLVRPDYILYRVGYGLYNDDIDRGYATLPSLVLVYARYIIGRFDARSIAVRMPLQSLALVSSSSIYLARADALERYASVSGYASLVEAPGIDELIKMSKGYYIGC
jgi:hypothetical protein